MNIEMLNDSTGKTSMMRSLVAFIVVIYTGVWAWLSISDGAMQTVDLEQVMMVAIPMVAKAMQVFGEGRDERK